MIIILSWESRGVRIFSLDEEEFNYRNVMFFFVSVCSVTLLYTLIMTGLGCLKMNLPSIVVSINGTTLHCSNSLSLIIIN